MEYNYETNCITNEKGKKIYLGNVENELFNCLFVQKRGQVCSKWELAEIVYGYNVDDNTVNNIVVYISRLKKKIGKTINIRTIVNKGYVIDL